MTHQTRYSHIGVELKRLRQRKRISFDDMSIKLGISHDELLEFEVGANMLSWGRIKEYANHLGFEIGLTIKL